MKKIHSIILTAGEPAGIGPDLLVYAAQKQWPVRLIACADPALLQDRADMLKLKLKLIKYDLNHDSLITIQQPQTLFILPIPLSKTVKIGKLNKHNSNYVIETLYRACDGCINGEFYGLVTGPINKKIINDAGIYFTGHTEFLAKICNSTQVVMMLCSKKLRIALATTHIALKEVSNSINKKNLKNIIVILHNELNSKFKIQHPIIYVCGLNPHAGEYGYIGVEEKKIIIPVIKKLHNNGIRVYGPFPADSIFQEKYLSKADVILTMFHDQGLPVLKNQSFGHAVNITLGLPFIRTSVDHGTALNIAGTNAVNPKSFFNAIELIINTISLTSNE